MDYRKRYRIWMEHCAGDADTMAELAALENDPREMEDRFYTSLSFGTGGMRGVLGAGDNRMNRYTVRRATRGLADAIHAATDAPALVVVAFDSRRMSAEFAKETALVLANNGVRAALFDSLRPVPVLSFAVRHMGALAGVVITASHNPPQYNGYKVYWEDGAQLPPERADAVQARIRAYDFDGVDPMDEAEARAKGLLVTVPAEVDDAYVKSVLALSVRPEMLREHGGDLRIVYTPLHGSGNLPVRRVLREAGVANLLVVPEQERPDGAFPTVRVPNPEEPDAFRLAIALADREGADAAFATDPDCDRLGVAVRDPEGKFTLFTGNQIGCLLLHYILSSLKERGELPQNGALVKSLVSTEMASVIASDFGVATIDTLTGFKFIAEQIQRFEETGEHTFLFGFEESYGYLSSTAVRDKDAVNASLLVTELALYLKLQGRTLYGQLQELFERYGYHIERTVSVSLPGRDGLEKMRAIMAALRENPPRSIGALKVLETRDFLRMPGFPPSDVLYYVLEGGCRVCVRPSGTEPKIKLYVNIVAKAEDAAAALSESLGQAARGLLQ